MLKLKVGENMKQLKCTQCGASINAETLTCEYCGSVYLNSENKKSNLKEETKPEISVRELSNLELSKLAKTLTKASYSSEIVVILFMIAWTSVAFFMFVNFLGISSKFKGHGFGGLGGDSIFAIVPLIFAIIGVVTIIRICINMFSGNISKEIKLIENGDFETAHESLEKREEKKHNKNYVVAMILIDYFKLNNFNEAKHHIINLPQQELAYFIKKSTVILEIADNLGVKTPEFSFTNFNDINYHGGGYSVRF